MMNVLSPSGEWLTISVLFVMRYTNKKTRTLKFSRALVMQLVMLYFSKKLKALY